MPQTTTCTRFGLIVAFFAALGLMTASPLQAQSLEEDLHAYSMECEFDVVADLLEQGANRNAVDEDGNSALILAAGGGCLDTVKVLLGAEVDPNLANSAGITALIDAGQVVIGTSLGHAVLCCRYFGRKSCRGPASAHCPRTGSQACRRGRKGAQFWRRSRADPDRAW